MIKTETPPRRKEREKLPEGKKRHCGLGVGGFWRIGNTHKRTPREKKDEIGVWGILEN